MSLSVWWPITKPITDFLCITKFGSVVDPKLQNTTEDMDTSKAKIL